MMQNKSFFYVSLYKHGLSKKLIFCILADTFFGQQQNNIDIYKRNFLIMVGKRD